MKSKYVLGALLIFLLLDTILSIILYMVLDELSFAKALIVHVNDFFLGIIQISEHSSPVTNVLSLMNAALGIFVIFGILIFLVKSILDLITIDTSNLENILSRLSAYIPGRKLFFSFFISSVLLITVLFKYIEDKSWLDSIYFVIITITTVGFGDLTPKSPITKVLTIILISNGIVFLGIASQIVFDRFIRMELKKFNLPDKALALENHVVIGGFGSKGRKLASLLRDRVYDIVVVEMERNRINLAETQGFYAIQADISKPSVLRLLNLDRAAGLFLALTDDNAGIQAGILARNLAPALDIYVEFQKINTYNIARYAGINRPISLSHSMLNVLQTRLSVGDYQSLYSLRDLRIQEALLGFIIVPIDANFEEYLPNYLVIGIINRTTRSIRLNYSPQRLEKIDPEVTNIDFLEEEDGYNHYLLAVDKELLFTLRLDTTQNIRPKRIVLAGFPEYADEFISRLDMDPDKIVVFWKNEDEKNRLLNKPYEIHHWSIENAFEKMEEVVWDDDLVLCLFEDITNSLIMSVGLNRLKRSDKLIQFIQYDYDIEPLVEVGAYTIITTTGVISEAMLSSFNRTNTLPPSFVLRNYHIFEHFIVEERTNDFFFGKTVEQLYSNSYIILYIKKASASNFREATFADKIDLNDRILVAIKQNE